MSSGLLPLASSTLQLVSRHSKPFGGTSRRGDTEMWKALGRDLFQVQWGTWYLILGVWGTRTPLPPFWRQQWEMTSSREPQVWWKCLHFCNGDEAIFHLPSPHPHHTWRSDATWRGAIVSLLRPRLKAATMCMPLDALHTPAPAYLVIYVSGQLLSLAKGGNGCYCIHCRAKWGVSSASVLEQKMSLPQCMSRMQKVFIKSAVFTFIGESWELKHKLY